MIYFFCGAHKNASHFQMHIMDEALKQKNVAYRYITEDELKPYNFRRARRFLAEIDRKRDHIFVCKGHWGKAKQRDVLLSLPSVRVFIIWRHILDVMISAYYYEKNRFQKAYSDFDDFYNDIGKILFIQQLLYRRVWDPVSSHPRVHIVSFEALKEDFASNTLAMLQFAKIDGVSIADLEAEVSLERLREKQDDPEGKFFRKGRPGEFKSFQFSQVTLNDMGRLEQLSRKRLGMTVLLHLTANRLGRMIRWN